MSDNLGVTPGSGASLRARDTGDGFLRQVGTLGAIDTEGATPHRLISAATNNATVVKATPGNVYAIIASNLNAAVRYLKLYDKATAPAPATDTALLKCVIALRASTDPIAITLPVPMKFATGIGYALVTGITDTDNTAVAASEILVNLLYA